jgi:hypothetical protein
MIHGQPGRRAPRRHTRWPEWRYGVSDAAVPARPMVTPSRGNGHRNGSTRRGSGPAGSGSAGTGQEIACYHGLEMYSE